MAADSANAFVPAYMWGLGDLCLLVLDNGVFFLTVLFKYFPCLNHCSKFFLNRSWNLSTLGPPSHQGEGWARSTVNKINKISSGYSPPTFFIIFLVL